MKMNLKEKFKFVTWKVVKSLVSKKHGEEVFERMCLQPKTNRCSGDTASQAQTIFESSLAKALSLEQPSLDPHMLRQKTYAIFVPLKHLFSIALSSGQFFPIQIIFNFSLPMFIFCFFFFFLRFNKLLVWVH